MDSPGGEFNSYKSKHLGIQTSKNIVIVEYLGCNNVARFRESGNRNEIVGTYVFFRP